jgi:hypothetical protein
MSQLECYVAECLITHKENTMKRLGSPFVVAMALLSMSFHPAASQGNEPPRIVCPVGVQNLIPGKEECVEIRVDDPDGDPVEVRILDDGSVAGAVSVVDQGGGVWLCCYTPTMADRKQQFVMVLEVSDGSATATCEIFWKVAWFAAYVVSLATPVGDLPVTPPPGTPVSVQATLQVASVPDSVSSLSLLIGWDSASLSLTGVRPGGLFDIPGAYEWEHFQYTEVNDCLGNCPGRLLRVELVADSGDGGHHPLDLVLDEEGFVLFTADFVSVEGAVFNGPYIPIQFFWMSCVDNSFQCDVFWSEPPGLPALGVTASVWDAEFEYLLSGSKSVAFPSYYGVETVCCCDFEPPDLVFEYISFVSVFPSTWWHQPAAHVDAISPNPSGAGQPVSFVGHGWDPDGNETVVNYQWLSSLDGELSTEASFTTGGLSVGEHLIRFRVQDADGHWSPDFTARLTVATPANTPSGNNVEVTLANGIVVTFEQVLVSGSTTVTVASTGPPPPTGYIIVPLGSPVFYDLSTTAQYVGDITICVGYDDSEVGWWEPWLALWHGAGDPVQWTNITASLDTDNNVICGVTSSLSTFVAASERRADCCQIRVGNANGFGTYPHEVTISDIQTLVTAKFISSKPCTENLPCLTEADVNQSGGVDPQCKDITISDIQTLVNHLFIAGPANAPLKDCL